MTRLMAAVAVILVWIGFAVEIRAQTVGIFEDDQNRRHGYVMSPTTGKAERIYPNLNALDFSDGREITESNVEQVARKILSAVEEFSHVDHEQLVLLQARKSKLGLWIISFDQVHRGFQVYGARYGVTIGRNNGVVSVGGDVYAITSVQTQGTVSEEPTGDTQDLGGLLDTGPEGGTGTVNEASDLEVSPTVTSTQVIQELLGDSEEAVIIDDPTLMIFPDVGSTGITYRMGWVASVDDGGDSRKVVVDAFGGGTLATESLVPMRIILAAGESRERFILVMMTAPELSRISRT